MTETRGRKEKKWSAGYKVEKFQLMKVGSQEMWSIVDGTIYKGLCTLFNVTKLFSNRATTLHTYIGRWGEMEVGVFLTSAVSSILVEIQ